MSSRLASLMLAVAAAAFTPIAAQAAGQAFADGWQYVGDSLIYVGTPNAVGKTRAEVQAELAATHRGAVGHDGWKVVGDSLIFVGKEQGIGKSRAQVQAELAAWVKNPVSHDGYREIGGDSLRYVGVQMSDDVRLAAGAGFTLSSGKTSSEAQKHDDPSGSEAQAERHFTGR